MTLSRGNNAFDLFLQLTRVCQVYLYTVLCMYSTCHPCSYEEESIQYTKRLENQFEALFGEFDFKTSIMQNGNSDNLSTEQIDLFQEVADWRLNNIALKESVTVISNYIDTHLVEDMPKVYEFGHERYMNVE